MHASNDMISALGAEPLQRAQELPSGSLPRAWRRRILRAIDASARAHALVCELPNGEAGREAGREGPAGRAQVVRAVGRVLLDELETTTGYARALLLTRLDALILPAAWRAAVGARKRARTHTHASRSALAGKAERLQALAATVRTSRRSTTENAGFSHGDGDGDGDGVPRGYRGTSSRARAGARVPPISGPFPRSRRFPDTEGEGEEREPGGTELFEPGRGPRVGTGDSRGGVCPECGSGSERDPLSEYPSWCGTPDGEGVAADLYCSGEWSEPGAERVLTRFHPGAEEVIRAFVIPEFRPCYAVWAVPLLEWNKQPYPYRRAAWLYNEAFAAAFYAKKLEWWRFGTERQEEFAQLLHRQDGFGHPLSPPDKRRLRYLANQGVCRVEAGGQGCAVRHNPSGLTASEEGYAGFLRNRIFAEDALAFALAELAERA